MKELTNEVYRTKRKLKLLKEEGSKQLLLDVLVKVISFKGDDRIPIDKRVEMIYNWLLKDYNDILEQYKPSEQKELF